MKYSLPLKTGFTTTRGFYITLSSKSTPELPNVFVKVVKTRNGITCTTGELIKLNDRINESLTDIYLMTNEVGCFVPASYASLKLINSIFSRIGSDDDIETNASTFTLEMREMGYILDNVTDDSLVIIDELGRGTGLEEGAALCFAISEHILNKAAPLVFFVTHFTELEKLEQVYPNVVNYHFKALQDDRFAQMKAKVDEVIHEDTYYQKGALHLTTQKCFAVKPHLNGMLDVARRAYSELIDDVAQIVKDLAQKYSLPLKTGFTTTRGFYITLSSKSSPELPNVFVKVVKTRNGITCTTGELIKLNDRINESLTDIYLMTNEVGCFVPASYASLKLINSIFSRIGSDDDIETNASTFTLEMREMGYILDNVTDDSLVIIDELGRGTGLEEGAALCFAISEHILNKAAPLVFFVTHFTELEKLEQVYPNVVNYHFKVDYVLDPATTDTNTTSVERINFLRKLTKGPSPDTNYGIKLAKLSAMPDSVTQEAEEISRELEEADKNQWKKKDGGQETGDTGDSSSGEGTTGLDTTLDSLDGDRRDSIIDLADRVVTAVQSGFNEVELARFLGQLQRQTIYREGS
eukprot:sb/3463356/